MAFKGFLEELAKIWLDMITVYNPDGVKLEEEVTNEVGEELTEVVDVPQEALQQLMATVKIDITPKGAFDKYAQEVSMENLLKNGYFNAERIGELEVYVSTLDDDSVMPKQKLEDAIAAVKEQQERIAMIEAQGKMMQQNAMQFLNGSPDDQASQMLDAMQQIEQEPSEEEVE